MMEGLEYADSIVSAFVFLRGSGRGGLSWFQIVLKGEKDDGQENGQENGKEFDRTGMQMDFIT